MIRCLLTNRDNCEEIAVIEEGRGIPYLDLINKAMALQPLLSQRQRENIAILLPDSGDYIAAFWGTIRSGMTAFPLSVLLTGHEMAPLLRQARVRTVITRAGYRRLLEEMAAAHALSLEIIYMEELKESSCEHDGAAAPAAPDAPMVLLNTSGTTGNCKIVQLSERNVEASVLGYLDKLRPEELEKGNVRFTLAAPFSSVYGIMILSACLMQSFPVVVLDQPFTLDTLFRTAEKHRVTHYEGGAFVLLLMEQWIGRPIPYDISTLTYFGTGGSRISGSTIERLQRAYKGVDFFHGYGMTEAAPLISKHPRAKVEKTESVGTAIRGLEIAVETEDGIARTPRTEGEIVVRGANVMLGYCDNEPETKRALKNGYLYTGDIGYLDEDGYLYICGRKKSMISVRGFKVHPEEVEECIQNSLLVKDCVVYGQTDDFGNEMVCADIVPIHPQVGREEIRMHCSVHLAGYKQPRRISFCENIKKNAAGKTDRRGGDSS